MNKKLKIDPERGPLVAEAFTLVASGRFVTTDAVWKMATSLGLRTRRGNVLSRQTFARMLSNPIYAGWVVSGDLKVEGQHPPLVSRELFDVVQQQLNRKPGVVHKKLNEDFPLRGIVKCAKCGRFLTAGWPKGRTNKYARYWCYTPNCHSVSVSRDDLDWLFKNLLGMIQPTAQLLAELPQRVGPVWQARVDRIAGERKRLEGQLAEQNALNQKAVLARVRGDISGEDFEALKASLAEEILRIQTALTTLNSEKATMEELLKQVQAEVVDVVGAWDKGNVNQRQELVKGFFPNGLVFSHELKFFEPANTEITEGFLRYLTDPDNFGVPDGI
ncbi:MAG TPA: recombinase family protein [Acidobacteriaceae bacterium]|nr:recombinase family protein [Acidobacteriaceae bacterium]